MGFRSQVKKLLSAKNPRGMSRRGSRVRKRAASVMKVRRAMGDS